MEKPSGKSQSLDIHVFYGTYRGFITIFGMSSEIACILLRRLSLISIYEKRREGLLSFSAFASSAVSILLFVQSFFIVLLVGADPGRWQDDGRIPSTLHPRPLSIVWQPLAVPLDIYLLCAGYKREIYCGMSFKVQTFWLPRRVSPRIFSFSFFLVFFFVLFRFFRDIFTCILSRAGLTVSMHAKWRRCRWSAVSVESRGFILSSLYPFLGFYLL